MSISVRWLVRALTPYGAVDWFRKWRALRTLGYRGEPWNFVDLNRTYWAAQRAGLTLLPEGTLPTLDVLVDVGANHGQWTENALTCITPETAILFEPEPHAFQSLESKFQGNRNIRLHDKVVGEKSGKTDFHVTASDDLSSVLRPNESLTETLGDHSVVQKTVEREVLPLDAALKGITEISLLKIDVQGFELPLLCGAQVELPS